MLLESERISAGAIVAGAEPDAAENTPCGIKYAEPVEDAVEANCRCEYEAHLLKPMKFTTGQMLAPLIDVPAVVEAVEYARPRR